MPIYEYKCEECGHIFEEWQKDFVDHDFPCPECNGESKRVMSNTSFILKGSGWYVTDYGKGNSGGNGGKPKSAATKSEKDSGSSSGSSSDGGDTASKPASNSKASTSESSSTT